MLHKLTSKLVFTCQNLHWFPHFFCFPVSQECFFWAGVIFSENRSTGLLPKPFWIVEMHHTVEIIWHSSLSCAVGTLSWSSLEARLQTNVSRRIVYQKAFSVGHKKDSLTYENMKTWQRKWCSWERSCDGPVMVRVFLLGILFRPPNCSGKELFKLGVSSPFQVSSCSLQIRAGSLLYIGLFWSWTPPPRHALSGIPSVRYEHKQGFPGQKRALSRSIRLF